MPPMKARVLRRTGSCCATAATLAALPLMLLLLCCVATAADNNPIAVTGKQVRDLNDLMQHYEQNMDLLAARKALAEALVARVVTDSIANQRSPLTSIDELLNGGLSNAINGQQQASDEENTESPFQAFIDDAGVGGSEVSAEKRAPLVMGSAYLQPSSVSALVGGSDTATAAGLKRPMMYNAHSFGFGLGKRQQDSATLVGGTSSLQATANHQFGKRPSTHRFDFGLGKRKSAYPRYDFGLGKRSVM